MPRFYFHLFNDVVARDEEGSEHPNLASARERAVRNMRFTLAESIKEHGRIVLDHRIEIGDPAGNVLDTVRVSEVVTIKQNDG